MAGVQTVQQHASSFELLGFDIMLDRSLKPWLIEVNGSPALSCDCATDNRVKPSLINDTIDTLGLDAFGEMSVAALQRRLSRRREDYMRLVDAVGATRGGGQRNVSRILGGSLPRALPRTREKKKAKSATRKKESKGKSPYILVNSVKDRLEVHREKKKTGDKRNKAVVEPRGKVIDDIRSAKSDMNTLRKIIGTRELEKEVGVRAKARPTVDDNSPRSSSAICRTGKFELAFPFNAEVAHAAMNIGDPGGLFGTKSAASKDPSWLQQQQHSTKIVVKAIAQLEREARKMQRGIT